MITPVLPNPCCNQDADSKNKKTSSLLVERKSDYIRLLLQCLFSRKARNRFREYRKQQKRNIRLFMTFLVKDEAEIIEKNIRFHKEMGVDGFIVTSHNSTDKTDDILKRLKKEGIVQEIFYKKSPYYEQSRWVGEMIQLARDKYNADWVINADADEFYYSKSLDLKESILKYSDSNVNVLGLDSNFLFPDGRDNFLECPYFCKKLIKDFEFDQLKTPDRDKYKIYTRKQSCFKVIHKTDGFVEIAMGNHDVSMKKRIMAETADICLYHYHIKNYRGYEAKVLNWVNTVNYMPDPYGCHVKEMVDMYKKGRLKENYDFLYSEESRQFLMNEGVVSIDPSVLNFLKYKKII